jgi:hypothetical protein
VTFVLTWTVGSRRGAFCPAGGLSLDEADEARARLMERMAELKVPAEAYYSAIVPYYFDVKDFTP